MVTINRNGVTLSASATANGFPLRSIVFTVPGMGDYARRPEGKERRRIRRDRIADKRAFLAN